MPRLAPRHLYACSALLILGVAASIDQDLGAIPEYVRISGAFGPSYEQRDVPLPSELPAHLEHVAELRRCVDQLVAAQTRYRKGISATLPSSTGVPLSDFARLADQATVGAYWEAYATYWPDYASALSRFGEQAHALQRGERTNGLYDVLAGLAYVEAAIWPAAADPLLDERQVDEVAPFTRVHDAFARAHGLELLRAGLRKPGFATYTAELVDRMIEPVRGTPLRQLTERLCAATHPEHPEELMLWSSGLSVVRLAASAPAEEQQSLLSLARCLGLRTATRLQGTLPLIFGEHVVLQAGAARAVSDPAAVAEHQRLDRMSRRSELPVDDGSRLGLLDRVAVRCGVWSRDYDPELNLGLDTALVRSLALWGLIATALCGLGWGAWVGRGSTAGCSASFRLGAALSVVAPSFGLAGAAVLFRPSWRVEFATLPVLVSLILAAGFSSSWLLRRAVRQRVGLSVQGWGPLLLVLGGSVGTWLTVDGGLHAAALLTQALGVAIAWVARDRTPPAGLAAFRGRVAVACASLALGLLALAEVAWVAPQRAASARSVETYYLETLRHGDRSWRGGEPFDVFLELEQGTDLLE